MTIEDVTWGDEKIPFWHNPDQGFIVRFRGQLTTDRLTAQNELETAFRADDISTVIRQEDGRDSVILFPDPFGSLIREVFKVETTLWAYPGDIHVVRYVGQLTRDSIEAYDLLETKLAEKELTPLFRVEDGRQVIILIPALPQPKPTNPWTNLLLFILTLLSVSFVGGTLFLGPDDVLPEAFLEWLQLLISGWPFAASLLGILLAHEFGHYFAGRFHKAEVTLPYFLPLPVQPFGTLGAFIQLRRPPKNKRQLLDIGIAGPLAGLVVAIPVLLFGLSLSEVSELPLFIPEGQGFQMEGNSIMYLAAKFAVFGELLPAPDGYDNMQPAVYWLRYMFTGRPLPLGGRDVLIHPIAMAGWGGLLVTALNLIPAGQLDGGHIIYVLLGKRARRLLPYIVISMILMGFASASWWLWAFLMFFLGRSFAEPLDQITELDPRRKSVALLGMVILVLTFTPVPLTFLFGPLV